MKLLKYIPIPFLCLINASYAEAAQTGMQKVLSRTFVGGPGEAILQLMLIAAVAALAMQISSALGKGQIANMIKLVATFSCIGIVITQISSAIWAVAKFVGLA